MRVPAAPPQVWHVAEGTLQATTMDQYVASKVAQELAQEELAGQAAGLEAGK